MNNEIKQYLYSKGFRDEMAEELSKHLMIRIHKSSEELADILRNQFGNL